jgi:chitinase
MRRLALFLAVVLALTGCSKVVTGSPAAAAQVTSAVGFTPYVDISVARPDLAQIAAASGLKNVALAFALAGPGGCEPTWGGTLAADDADLVASVAAFRKAGGEVTVATGGAVGKYLENACGTAAELAGAYGKLLDTMGTNRLDVDIEAPVNADLIAEALSQLQRSRGTAVTLTLPIDLAGLPAPSLDLVQKVAAKGVLMTVNGMDMNFRTGGDWGQAMVDAGQATLDQLRRVYPDGSEASQNKTLGLTVMIGRNDAGPVTTVDDAKKVLEFAKSRGVGHLGIWSLGRDTGKCPKRVKPAVDCSGIAQQDLEFTKLFTGFNGPNA